MSKSKIADEEIRKYISEGKNNAQIAKALGTSQPNINTRCNKLRKEYGNLLPDPEPEAKKAVSVEQLPPEPAETIKPFPFEPKEPVIFAGQHHTVRSVGETRMVLVRNANMQAVTIMLEDYNAGRAQVRKVDEKKPNAFEKIIRNHKRPDEDPEVAEPKIDFLDLPEKSAEDEPEKTVFEKVAAKAKSDRKPANVNPDFETAVQEMEEERYAPTVESLFVPEAAKEKAIPDLPIIPSLLEGRKPATINQEFEDLFDQASQFHAEPISLDLEMQPNTDETVHYKEVKPFENSPEPKDYIDPEWFEGPEKGTIEYRMWQEYLQKIQKIDEARSAIRKALDSGDRLPAEYVQKYNGIVSKYQEVGA